MSMIDVGAIRKRWETGNLCGVEGEPDFCDEWVPALLSEVEELRRDVEAAAGGLVEATYECRELRKRLDRAEAALKKIAAGHDGGVVYYAQRYWRRKEEGDADDNRWV